MLLAHATSPSFQYFHAWEAGDVLIWDNSQTLHQSMPYDNDGRRPAGVLPVAGSDKAAGGGGTAIGCSSCVLAPCT